MINLSIQKHIALSLLLFILFSCSNPTKMELVLREAGDNRLELEKVLVHYNQKSEDSLKYKAACFLIENMPRHYTYKDESLSDYYTQLEFIFKSEINDKEKIAEIDSLNNQLMLDSLDIAMDINNVDAVMLVSHIEAAFKTRDYPWNFHIPFTDFCEYVLPYRVSNEPVQNWMPEYTKYTKSVADSIYTVSNTYQDFVSKLSKYFSSQTRRRLAISTSFPIEIPPTLFLTDSILIYQNCKELSMQGVYLFRSLGIPVSWDFTPNWANRSHGHDWNGMILDEKYYPFALFDNCQFGDHLRVKTKEKPSKIFRRMFSSTENRVILDSQEETPDLFKTPLLDISDVYIDGHSDPCVDIDLEFDYPVSKEHKLVYLMIFNNTDWVPVDWAERSLDKAFFRKTRKNSCYMISYYQNGRFISASAPFYITDENKIVRYRANTDVTRKVILNRKYPTHFFASINTINLPRMIGGKFQVANKLDFSDAIDIHTTSYINSLAFQPVVLKDSIRTRYFRYISAPNAHVFVAEINIYNEHNQKLTGEVIGTDGSFANNGFDKTKVFDGNPFTYFDAPVGSDCWVGLDFGEEKTISKFAFLPRSDDNHVAEGEEYELFYYDREWKSLGKKVGDNSFVLEYDSVPNNALLHLKNHTKGKQERIFTYEQKFKEEQIWW